MEPLAGIIILECPILTRTWVFEPVPVGAVLMILFLSTSHTGFRGPIGLTTRPIARLSCKTE